MRDIPNKTNLISSYDADEFNEFYKDVANCVISESIALDGADEDQLEECVNRKVTVANRFTASGGTDVIVLSPNAPRKGPKILANGMVIRFLPTGDNTTTTPTVNISALGAKTIVRNLADDPVLVGDIKQGFMRELTYSLSLDKFYITQGELSTFNTVETASIDSDAVTNDKIATNAVTNVEIATDTILSTNIAADAVGNSEIATDAVTNVEIGTNTILATNIATGAVGSDEIAANAVGTSEIATNAVTNIEIGVNTILATNIATDAVGSDEIAANAVGTSEINTNAVTNVEIATDTILSTNIAAGEVGQSELSTNSVISDKIFAGAVTNAKIGSSAVHQAELQTSISGVATSSTAFVPLVLPGGEYGFYPQVRVTNTYAMQAAVAGTNHTVSSYTTNIGIVVSSGAATGEAQQRHITSSPPYDLGDGEIPFFIFLLFDDSGKVICSYCSEVPPWAYNGPTRIQADVTKKGKKYRKVKKLLDFESGQVEEVEEEITNDLKNKDMILIPHPFPSAEQTDSIILLDPVETLKLKETWDALLYDDSGDLTFMELLHNDYLKVETDPLVRSGPNGVTSHSFRWKKTR